MGGRIYSRAIVRCALLAVIGLGGAWELSIPGVAFAQIVREPPKDAPAGIRLGQPIATRYRVGAEFKGRGGTVQDIRSMVAVPLECPEQHVDMLEEDLTPNVETFEYRQTDEGVRQMLIGVPHLSPHEDAHALMMFEVVTSPVLPPEDMSTLHVPAKPGVKIKRYLGRSPFIDVNHRKIKKAVEEALAAKDEAKADEDKADEDAEDSEAHADGETADVKAPTAESTEDVKKKVDDEKVADEKTAADEPADDKGADEAGEDAVAKAPIAVPATGAPAAAPKKAPGPPSADWVRIEKLYDYARKKVKYLEGEDKSSVQALTDGQGDCQGIAALFVAMCRTEKVPARMVWADGHQYAEFYLENATGAGRWYPCESAGARAFGEMPTARVILQKGDNFRVPERPRDRLRYASDFTLLLSKPGSQPKIAYIRESL